MLNKQREITITIPKLPLYPKLLFTKLNRRKQLNRERERIITIICLSINLFSNKSPELFETTGSSGTSPETAKNQPKEQIADQKR